MPQLDYFQAHIFVDRNMLQEYPAPEEDAGSDHIRTCYVEVETGQKFRVEFTWLQDFELHRASALCAEVQFDNKSERYSQYINCSDVDHAKGRITTSFRREMCSLLHKDKATRMWKQYKLTFGVLGLNDKPSDDTLTVDAMKKLGSIRIRFFRGKKIKRNKPGCSSGIVDPPLDEVPEKLLKGKGIKNNVKFEEGKLVSYTPSANKHDYVPIEGPHGTIQEFVFLYRQRNALQHLGVIPRSPSPEPDTKLMLERTEETLKLTKQKEREARMQNLELREQLNKLRSGGSCTNAEQPDQNAADQGSKRAREDENDDELTEMAPPPRKPKVLVDLTEDDDD